jgi:hypothetical protein
MCRHRRFWPPSRYHLHESVVQKAVAHAARLAGIVKRVGPHTPAPLFTRQRWRVTTQFCRLADGFDDGLRA